MISVVGTSRSPLLWFWTSWKKSETLRLPTEATATLLSPSRLLSCCNTRLAYQETIQRRLTCAYSVTNNANKPLHLTTLTTMKPNSLFSIYILEIVTSNQDESFSTLRGDSKNLIWCLGLQINWMHIMISNVAWNRLLAFYSSINEWYFIDYSLNYFRELFGRWVRVIRSLVVMTGKSLFWAVLYLYRLHRRGKAQIYIVSYSFRELVFIENPRKALST